MTSAAARLRTSEGQWRDVSDMTPPEILEEIDRAARRVEGALTPKQVPKGTVRS